MAVDLGFSNFFISSPETLRHTRDLLLYADRSNSFPDLRESKREEKWDLTCNRCLKRSSNGWIFYFIGFAIFLGYSAATKQRVSLTTDNWVAPSTCSSYMVITLHFIDSSWHLHKLIIGFKYITDHKGSTIASVLLECLEEWGIKKVFTITVDNATANTTALKLFQLLLLANKFFLCVS